MGVDDEWMEQEERGWRDPKKWVCQHCVGGDTYLRHLVRVNLSTTGCTYCRNPKRKAAPLSVLMDALLRGVKYSYNDEANAGYPYDREFPIEYMGSEGVLQQVLASQDIEWNNALVRDVANAFTNTGWVDAPDGEFMGSYHHERLHWSWSSFANAVKHRSRFHFQTGKRVRRHGDDLVGVHEMLPFLGQLVRRHRLVRALPHTTVLHRVRPGAWPHTVADLGAPPESKSRAGRMNPAGVPYLYLAFDEKTALAETRVTHGQEVTVSQWSPVRDLQVIDLSQALRFVSVFSEKRQEYEMVQFIAAFRDEISKTVAHDGSEHFEYVPTQVVSEYFAQAFTFGAGKRIDGLVYPSAVEDGGKNLVVFPRCEPETSGLQGLPFAALKFGTARSGRVHYSGHSVV